MQKKGRLWRRRPPGSNGWRKGVDMGTSDGLSAALADEVRRRVFEEPGFMRLTQVARYGGRVSRLSFRPVELKTGRALQMETGDAGRIIVSNLDDAAAHAAVEEVILQPGARELHVQTATADLHIRVTHKGRELVSRSKPLAREAEEALPHDRVKQQPLTDFDSGPLLKALEIADADGRIKASMRGKYDQVNAFLRILDTTVTGGDGDDDEIVIADCGCGKAYITFAAYFYLTHARKRSVKVRGIDRNVELITAARRLAADLGVNEDVRFVAGELADSTLDLRPNLTISLHACDTATDEALARAVEWKCPRILCAPCCQHELNKGLAGGGAMKALLRHGILRERLADLLTDTFRAQLLRILGYRVKIMEFVSHDATAKNLLLRAEYGVAPGQGDAVAEYRALRDLWQAAPWLEKRLGESVSRFL
jgi:hypothetical protein